MHHNSTKKILDDNPELKNQWTSLIPQGKMGNPEDLMGPVTFLLSDASSYVTGKHSPLSIPAPTTFQSLLLLTDLFPQELIYVLMVATLSRRRRSRDTIQRPLIPFFLTNLIWRSHIEGCPLYRSMACVQCIWTTGDADVAFLETVRG